MAGSIIEKPQPQQLTIDQALYLAIQHHQAGRLREAEQLYLSILSAYPNHAWANHNIGILASQCGNHKAALFYQERATQSFPSNVMFANDYAYALSSNGFQEKALDIFRKILESEPDNIAAINGVGVCLLLSGNLDSCRDWLENNIKKYPDQENLKTNLGECLQRMCLYEDSISVLRDVIKRNPMFFDAKINLGVSLRKSGYISEAVEVLSDVVSNVGGYAAFKALAACFFDLDRIDESGAMYLRSLELKRDDHETLNGYSAVLAKQERLKEAEQIAREALAINPQYPDALTNLGSILSKQERLKEAEQAYKEALRIKPGYPEALWGLSCTLLSSGIFSEGWSCHDIRFSVKEHKNPLRFDSSRMWSGETISGKRTLVWAEQGYGDQIQMFRYIAKLKEMGAEVLVEANPELVPLFQNSSLPDLIIKKGDSAPEFDVHIPFMSLPKILFGDLKFYSETIPYLRPSDEKLKYWRRVLRNIPGYRLGIVWAGNPAHKNDRNRSLRLEHLSPLSELPNVSLVSLQKGAGEQQVADCSFPIFHLGDQIQDFEDTAAILEYLDLLISVDTSVAHLAGALGRPVWTLLPTAPDWRWMLKREDSPWYPSMRLFRQPAQGDWDSVIHRVANELNNQEHLE